MRDAFIMVGGACALIGLLLRQRNGAGRGFSMALIVVGLMMIAAGPLGRMWNLW